MKKKSLFFLLYIGIVSFCFCLISVKVQSVQAADKTSVGVRFSETKPSETTESTTTMSSSSKPSTTSSVITTTSDTLNGVSNLPKTGSTDQSIYLYIGIVVVIGVGVILLYKKRSRR